MQETFLTLSAQDLTAINNSSKKKKHHHHHDLQDHRRKDQHRSQGSSRRVAPAVSDPEKALPNGDLYTGTLSGKVPHGRGKYLWADGCMYEGDWRRGRACGRGRFSWPSGATYEGEFKSGRMDGFGTFLGPDGDTYTGSWLSDRKHGFGQKRYANGDLYDGEWFRDLQHGRGRYVWSANASEYVGEWCRGAICGYGVLIWGNGNRFEGFWENGVPKGKGTFTWSNSNSSTPHHPFSFFAAPPDANANANANSNSNSNSNFPRICIWELDGEAGDITCDIVDNAEASMFYNNLSPCSGEPEPEPEPEPRKSVAGECKKPGQTVSKGHKKYDLMLNVQLGIRYTVGKHASMLRELKSAHFDPNHKFWTRFPPEGSKFTPPHHSVDFKWKDYCPMVFRHLRELFAIDSADYMLAICGNDALREFSSPGKSGSFFYLTQDDRFIIKTVKKSEVKVLIRMLPTYYQHVCQYKNSLVTKFFGVHCVKPVGGQKTRFIVMGNLFCSEYRIHKRFDLKGSSHGRTIDKREGEIDETTTLKDLDLDFVFRLERSWFQELIWQIERDCEFLEAERIMDYSLLIGIHFRGDNSDTHSVKTEIHHDELLTRAYRLTNGELQDMERVSVGRGPLIRLGANMPGRAERVSNKMAKSVLLEGGGGESTSSSSNPHSSSTPTSSTTPNGNGNCGEMFDVILYFGIIDILQDYDISKKLEHAYKSLQVDPTSISAVDPKLYSKRFRDFIHTIFLQDTTDS